MDVDVEEKTQTIFDIINKTKCWGHLAGIQATDKQLTMLWVSTVHFLLSGILIFSLYLGGLSDDLTKPNNLVQIALNATAYFLLPVLVEMQFIRRAKARQCQRGVCGVLGGVFQITYVFMGFALLALTCFAFQNSAPVDQNSEPNYYLIVGGIFSLQAIYCQWDMIQDLTFAITEGEVQLPAGCVVSFAGQMKKFFHWIMYKLLSMSAADNDDLKMIQNKLREANKEYMKE